MKVSIITVCHNNCKTLERTLQSVIAQDWHNREHIVIDGGSTDDTLSIIDRYRSHLAYFVTEPDDGIYDAMNKGLAAVSGDIICTLNADDYYISSEIISQVALKMNESNLDVLMGDVEFFHSKNPDRVVRHYRSDRFRPQRLSWGWMPAHPALFLRRSVVDRVGKFRKDYRIAGDFEYIVRVFEDPKLCYEYMPRTIVRMQLGGISNSGLFSKILLNLEVIRACRENGLKTNLLKILAKYPLKALEIFTR